MKVTTVAHTHVVKIPEAIRGTEFAERADWGDPKGTTDIDILGEMAGRGCYKSWTLPNPKTATNEGYLGNILDHKHFSVLEHGSVTFYVEGVSRALLLELERHRFTSYSVESQRYVSTSKHHKDVVTPPAFEDHPGVAAMLQAHYERSLELYDSTYQYMRDTGLSVKKSREAARSFLLESTPVDLFVTGNIRCWRDVLGKRFHEDADAEIQEFSSKVLDELRKISPNSVLDIPTEPAK